MVQGSQKVRILELRKDEGMHFETPCSAAEQVHFSAFEFPRARAADNEAELLVFDEPVDFVERLGNLLFFIKDDWILQAFVLFRQQLFPEEKGPLGELEKKIGFEEIEDQAVGELLLQESRFSRFPRSPKERRLVGRELDFQQTLYVTHFGLHSEKA